MRIASSRPRPASPRPRRSSADRSAQRPARPPGRTSLRAMEQGREHGRRLATLGDVAELAGVSRSTVSNVVRGSDVVAARTRRRVLSAIEELGYRPNALARQLLQGRATTIGIIARDLRNPFIAEMASLVEREVARFGFAAMFCATEGDPQREEQAVGVMLDNRVSGLVFLSFLDRPGVIGSRINGQI